MSENQDEEKIKQMIDELVEKAKIASKELWNWQKWP